MAVQYEWCRSCCVSLQDPAVFEGEASCVSLLSDSCEDVVWQHSMNIADDAVYHCRIQQYLRERQAREDEEAQRKAGKKEVADRIYERLKGQAEAEAAAREEEDHLINLLRAEEEAERARK